MNADCSDSRLHISCLPLRAGQALAATSVVFAHFHLASLSQMASPTHSPLRWKKGFDRCCRDWNQHREAFSVEGVLRANQLTIQPVTQ